MTTATTNLLLGDVRAGDTLPDLPYDVTATTIVLGALAARDWRPMHHDHDFAVNRNGTRDIFMNTVGWLSQQENLISIRPVQAGDSRITLTASEQSFITWMSLLLIPGAIFGTGFYAWWRRR